MTRIALALVAVLGLTFARPALAERQECSTDRDHIVLLVTSEEGWGPKIRPDLHTMRSIGCTTKYVDGTPEPTQCDALRQQILFNFQRKRSAEAGTIQPVIADIGCKTTYTGGRETPMCRKFVDDAVGYNTTGQPGLGAAVLQMMGQVGCKPEE